MSQPLYIISAGAVTPVGLNAAQTCAAIRARLSMFEEVYLTPNGKPQIAAQIPANSQLKQMPGEWLLNMASRAITEALREVATASDEIALLLAIPESFRHHPSVVEFPVSSYIAKIQKKLGRNFHSSSRILEGGAGSIIQGIQIGRRLIHDGITSLVILGGVDSYLNEIDFERLKTTNRIKAGNTAQGLLPSEGASFVTFTGTPMQLRKNFSASIHGIGLGHEENAARSESYSVGSGINQALSIALAESGFAEADLDFVISNANGERYQGWEAMIARPRFYRTRREFLPILYPAMFVGELGAASAALNLLYCANSFCKRYAPGTVAMCEIASEGVLRGACVMQSNFHQ